MTAFLDRPVEDADRLRVRRPSGPQAIAGRLRNSRELSVRFLALIVVIGLPGWVYFADWVEAVRSNSPYRAQIAPIVVAVAVAFWRQATSRGELPIHDRQVDIVTALGVASLAATLTLLLAPRFRDLEGAGHFNLLSIPLWIFAVCCALFGTRPTWRHRHSFVILLLVWPVPYDLAARWIPAMNFGWWMLAVAATAGSVVVLQVRFTFRLALSVITVAVTFAYAVLPRSAAGPLAVLIGLGAPVALVSIVRWERPRPGSRIRHWVEKRPPPPVVGQARLAMLGALTLAAAWTILAGGGGPLRSLQDAPPGTLLGQHHLSTTCPNISGWTHTGSTQSAPSNAMGRLPSNDCSYVRGRGLGATRALVSITAPVPELVLEQFPWEAVHKVIGSEEPATGVVHLGRGVHADLLVYEAPLRPLTTVIVTWDWTLGGHSSGRARRISVVVTDDPLLESPFPVAAPNLGPALADRLQDVMRTNLTKAVRYEVHAKNEAVATAIARQLVSARAPAFPSR